jgi:transposase
MGQPDVVSTPAQRAEVERQLQRTELRRRVRERREMVKAAVLGDEVARIARWSGRAVETVSYGLARFRAGGVAARADAPRAGRPVQADAA